MATISSGTQFLGLSTDYPTIQKRSALINSQSQFYRMQDLKFNTSGDALSFVVDKNEVVSNQPNIKYYKLGIDFGGLDFTQGNTYTLLIDRYRFAEIKNTLTGKKRQARFYHEKLVNAITNQRQNEIVITSNFQFVDFNQDRYFKFNPLTYKPNNKGMGLKGQSINGWASYLNLGFRLRIDNGVDAPVETGYIGYAQMIAQADLFGDIVVSYRY